MLSTFLAVLPIFLLIVVGHIARKFFIKEENFWGVIDKLVYYIFFPSLLFLDVSRTDLSTSETLPAVMSTVSSTFVLASVIFVFQMVLKNRNDLFTSIFQGGVRYNSYVFIALSESLFGKNGVAVSGIFVAYMIVMTNVMSVVVMNHYGNGGKKSWSGVIYALLKNPLIVAAVAGVVFNFMGLGISNALGALLSYLGNASTPLSLMSVGAGLVIKMRKKQAMATAYSVFMKLIALPVITMVFLFYFKCSGMAAGVAILYASVPCAGNAYILSRQMGGDSEAMASIITWSTLLSVVTITLIFSLNPIQ